MQWHSGEGGAGGQSTGGIHECVHYRPARATRDETPASYTGLVSVDKCDIDVNDYSDRAVLTDTYDRYPHSRVKVKKTYSKHPFSIFIAGLLSDICKMAAYKEFAHLNFCKGMESSNTVERALLGCDLLDPAGVLQKFESEMDHCTRNSVCMLQGVDCRDGHWQYEYMPNGHIKARWVADKYDDSVCSLKLVVDGAMDNNSMYDTLRHADPHSTG